MFLHLPPLRCFSGLFFFFKASPPGPRNLDVHSPKTDILTFRTRPFPLPSWRETCWESRLHDTVTSRAASPLFQLLCFPPGWVDAGRLLSATPFCAFFFHRLSASFLSTKDLPPEDNTFRHFAVLWPSFSGHHFPPRNSFPSRYRNEILSECHYKPIFTDTEFRNQRITPAQRGDPSFYGGIRQQPHWRLQALESSSKPRNLKHHDLCTTFYPFSGKGEVFVLVRCRCRIFSSGQRSRFPTSWPPPYHRSETPQSGSGHRTSFFLFFFNLRLPAP